MSEENKDKQNEGGKVAKKFAQNILMVQALLGDKPLALPKKLSLDAVEPKEEVPEDEKIIDAIVREVFQEENAQLKEEVKTGLRNLLKKHVEFEQAVAAKKKEVEQTELQKKKEFNEECAKLFGKVTGIEKKMQQYKESLKAAGKDVPEEPKEEAKEEEE